MGNYHPQNILTIEYFLNYSNYVNKIKNKVILKQYCMQVLSVILYVTGYWKAD